MLLSAHSIDLDKKIPSRSGLMPWTIQHSLSDHNFASAFQQVVYPDPARTKYNMDKLSQATPLVTMEDVSSLKNNLAYVAQGNAHVIQAGLCVEDMKPWTNRSYGQGVYGLVCDLAKDINSTTGKYVVPIARVAGQVSKPRSMSHEQVNGETVLTYRGPMVHDYAADKRTPNPVRLVETYENAKQVLAAMDEKRRDIAMWPHNLKVHASHEALSLPYEIPQLRKTPQGDVYASSAPFLWVGNRTRPNAQAPHVQFAALVDNPIGLKCDANMAPELLAELISTINHERQAGKLALIMRMGANCHEKNKDRLFSVAKMYQSSVVMMVDPMHGNTVTDPISGKKTRHMDAIIHETEMFVDACRKHDIHPGGLHLEASAQPVTECLGGNVTTLRSNYQTLCDPCLNPIQAKAVTQRFTQALNKGTKAQYAVS